MTELPNLNFFGPSGWRCPQCGRIYSPSTIMCYYCNNQQTYVTDHTTGTPIKEYVQNWNDYLNISTSKQEDKKSETTSSTTFDWNKYLNHAINIFDYPNVDQILNPTNIINDKDTFQVHFDKMITYEV